MLKNFNLDKYLNELKQMVNIDSGSYDKNGVKKVNDIIKEKFKEIGFKVEEKYFNEKVAPCLQITNTDEENYDVLILAHSDTVFKDGTVKERPFSMDGDKAYGPGVIDMKSGLLSTYYAVKNISDEDMPKICIAVNSHEEISSIYSKDWMRELAKKSKICLVTEPARKNGELVNKRKGLARYNLEFIGKAVHSGIEPENGINAVNELGHWIVELEKFNDYENGTSLNVGIVKGGTAANVIPDNANCSIDIRFEGEDILEKIDKKMNEMKIKPFIPGVETKMERLGFRPPMNPTEDTKKLEKLILELAEKNNIKTSFVGTGGGSDANFSAIEGTPSIDGLGPVGSGTHGVNEYLEINSIEERIKLLRDIIIKIK
jgi:glutamate carboxypeptidase